MILNLLYGRAGSGKTSRVMTEIRRWLTASPTGNPLLLILPEHATFQTERELAATPGLGGFTRVQVVGFKRLAYRVLQETGGALRPRITELGKRLVLSRLLSERQASLRAFQRAAGQPAFAETLAGILLEFKTYAITPPQLATVVAAFGDTPLSGKLHDLNLLYQDFTAFLRDRYTDPEDCLGLVAAKAAQSALLRGAEVWVDGFTWFNPREMAVLTRIMQTAAAVTVTLCLSDPRAPEHQAETALFHRQWETRRQLLAAAAELGVTVRETELTAGRRFINPVLEHVERYFFEFPLRPWPEKPAGVVIAEAANRKTEAEGIARDIIRLSREAGYRWRDIAILLRDPENYGEIVETALADYEIPFFSDRRRPLIHHPLAELLRSAVETVTGNWRYEPVFRCLKTGLFAAAPAEVDKLENYVLEFGLRGSHWTTGGEWRFSRRFALGEEAEEPAAEQLAVINNIRFRATGPLLNFDRQFKQAVTVREATIALYGLLAELAVPDTLDEWAAKAEAAGDLAQAREHRQVWRAVVELLEQLVEAGGDSKLDAVDYETLIGDGLEGLELSLIPPSLDQVTVSPLIGGGTVNVRAVYIPGVNEGVLPMRSHGEGLLTDAEREKLAGLGIELAPGARADVFAEWFLVYTALTRAAEYLWISYPLADAEGQALNPSLVVKRLQALTATPSLKALPVEPEPGREREYLARPRRSLSALAVSLRQYKRGRDISPVWWDVYNWLLTADGLQTAFRTALSGLFDRNEAADLPAGTARRLYAPGGRLRGSVTRFESFRACPFRHFVQYGLGLKPRPLFQLQALDLGQFFHVALKQFGDRLAATGREWDSMTEAEVPVVCGEIVELLAPQLQNEILLSSARHRYLTNRLRRTVESAVDRLVRFARTSGFKPRRLEQKFGAGPDAWPPLELPLPGGAVCELTGQIDRLDVAEHHGDRFVLIIDYKSGGAWLRLPDFYYGLRLQLITYLLVVCRTAEKLFGRRYRPAGVLYYFLKNPVLTTEGPLTPAEATARQDRQLRLPGWVLADPEIACLVDGTLTDGDGFLKVRLTKNGAFAAPSAPYVKTSPEFAALLAHAAKILRQTAAGILAGDTAIRPFKLGGDTACQYCLYRPVCQFDRRRPENDFVRLGKLTDREVMARLRPAEEDEE